MKDNQQELFVVVDENDQILGYRTRYDCHHDKSLIHRGVGVILFNDEGKVLLQKRSVHKDTHPGYYDIAASGHVSKGETYEETVVREMKEEIGVTAELTFITKKLIHFPQETEYDAFFRGVHNGPFTISKDEVDKVVFATYKELRDNKYKLTEFAQIALKSVGVL